MYSVVKSCALTGIDGIIVEVETDLASGVPMVDLVGLPDSAVKESKERVRSAIKNSGFDFPLKRVTINLAPADIRKEGPSFDLPIAVAILQSSGYMMQNSCEEYMIMGELSLDGQIRAVNGVLPMVYAGFKAGIKKFIVPFENADEAALVKEAEIYPVKNLAETINFLKKRAGIDRYIVDENEIFVSNGEEFLDFADVERWKLRRQAVTIFL